MIICNVASYAVYPRQMATSSLDSVPFHGSIYSLRSIPNLGNGAEHHDATVKCRLVLEQINMKEFYDCFIVEGMHSYISAEQLCCICWNENLHSVVRPHYLYLSAYKQSCLSSILKKIQNCSKLSSSCTFPCLNFSWLPQ